jgi:Rps23 Pro-64 3,4-dihydroxylase Tpa1-like proline 4-hydroxylase
MTMVYHIGVSPDMAPDCGGHLRWYGGVGMEEFAPSFNTLYLFVPHQHSYHSIKPIKCGARYALVGWLYGKDRDKYKPTDEEKRIVRLSKN